MSDNEKPRSKPAPKRERDRDYKHYPSVTPKTGYGGKPLVERPPMLRPPQS